MFEVTSPRQLLQAWNPLTEPLTMQVHVENLLKSSAPFHTWFGRIYVGSKDLSTAEAARAKWPQVADVADEMERTRRNLLLLATNFQSLHALRVDRILFGTATAPEQRARVPDYYRNRSVAIWFRVRDVKAIHHDQMATLLWLRDNVGMEERGGSFGGFDPFQARLYDYPVVVRSLPEEDVFDYSRLRRKAGRADLFAAAPGTVFPPNLDAALRLLRQEMDPPWSRLEGSSRHYLAGATLAKSLDDSDVRPGPDVEASAACTLLAKAVELELRTLLTLLKEKIPRAAAWATRGDLSRLGLGEMRALLLEVASDIPERFGLSATLARKGEWTGWLEEFVGVRNSAVHAEHLSTASFLRHRDSIIARSSKSRLELLCEAKRQLQNDVPPPPPRGRPGRRGVR